MLSRNFEPICRFCFKLLDAKVHDVETLYIDAAISCFQNTHSKSLFRQGSDVDKRTSTLNSKYLLIFFHQVEEQKNQTKKCRGTSCTRNSC